nr:type II toxin-antitoxin system RelE/ParE family toxin [Rhizobium skierniewicense]
MPRETGRFSISEGLHQIGNEAEDLPLAGIRRFVMGVYLVDYEVRRHEIVILTVRHGQQKPPSLTIDDDFDYEE